MVAEAVTLKVQVEDAKAAKEAEKKREKEDWKANRDHLRNRT